VVAPILIVLGIPDLDALRVAAIANNAPVSYGALGAPIIALAAVTAGTLGMQPNELLLPFSSAVGHIVAILALLPPWILIYLVSGRRGIVEAWPLAIVGSLGYIAGQLPVAVFLGPYLPDAAGSIVCFAVLLGLLRIWRPRTIDGYGGRPLTAAEIARADSAHGLSAGQVFEAWMPFAVLVVVVVLWTGPWSPLPKVSLFALGEAAGSAVAPGTKVSAIFNFNFAPFVGGTAILASWIIVAVLLRLSLAQLRHIFGRTWQQMWGALLVGVFIFGLA
jgi:lactate permease